MSAIGEVLWSPSAERVERAQITRFRKRAAERAGRPLETYADLWTWSIRDPEAFWDLIWDFSEVLGEKGSSVVEDFDRMPGARWFPGGRLNFARNLLRRRDDAPALVSRDETGRRRVLSYADLYAEVSRCQQALVEAGVGVGDRVAAYMPNTVETVVAMLATTALGAVWSSCSQDFGIQAALDRLGQIQPKVLVTADGYRYAEKDRPAMDRVRELRRSIPSLGRVLLVHHLSGPATDDGTDIEDLQAWSDAVSAREAGPVRFEELPFDHPVYILYSSGTTGLPKAIVHGAGGTLLQHLKELRLHTDLREGERIAYYTTCGWMMWNWLVSSLAVGATVVLIDGSPFHPVDTRLFDLVDEERLHVLGTSAKWIALAEKRGLCPRRTHRLEHLRAVLSTGSPLAPEGFDWVYRDVGDDVQLASISGGTDIVSCFALGDPAGPVHRGEIQVRGLGMAVEVYDEEGRALGPGQPGELVCTRPFPSMPVSFYGDEDGSRYRAAYFEYFEGVWRHGDWVELTPHGGLIIHGRSDATLNPGGVRIGTAEIYRVVECLDEVLEAVVVGQKWQDDVRVILFVKLREGVSLDEDLRRRLRERIREGASPHHVPRVILEVPDIPRTVSGKISEIAVRRVLHGQPLSNRDALANPEALAYFQGRPELRVRK